ncbi:hypothetical protein ACP4OV_013399 [Aristida adscensionis]
MASQLKAVRATDVAFAATADTAAGLCASGTEAAVTAARDAAAPALTRAPVVVFRRRGRGATRNAQAFPERRVRDVGENTLRSVGGGATCPGAPYAEFDVQFSDIVRDSSSQISQFLVEERFCYAHEEKPMKKSRSLVAA